MHLSSALLNAIVLYGGCWKLFVCILEVNMSICKAVKWQTVTAFETRKATGPSRSILAGIRACSRCLQELCLQCCWVCVCSIVLERFKVVFKRMHEHAAATCILLACTLFSAKAMVNRDATRRLSIGSGRHKLTVGHYGRAFVVFFFWKQI